jgi:hypothetical protein
MLKFKFNYQNNRLAYYGLDNTWHELTADKQFTSRFGNLGFNLPNGQIIFATSPSKVKVSYRKRKPGGDLAYFNKELAKGEIIFEVKEKDEVEKREGKWVKKGGPNENTK